MKMNLNNFGKNLKFKKRTKKVKIISEREVFIQTLEILEACWNKSMKAYDLFKINLLEYEEDYYQVIENLILVKYGNFKTELIMWYIFNRIDIDGNINPLLFQDEEEEIILSNPTELWEFLIKLDKNNE